MSANVYDSRILERNEHGIVLVHLANDRFGALKIEGLIIEGDDRHLKVSVTNTATGDGHQLPTEDNDVVFVNLITNKASYSPKAVGITPDIPDAQPWAV